MKKILKILGLISFGLLMLLIGVILIIFKALPSPKELGTKLNPAKTQSPSLKTTMTNPIRETTSGPVSTSEKTQLAKPENDKNVNLDPNSDTDQKILAEMRDRNTKLVDICTPIVERRMHLDPKVNFRSGMEEAVESNQREALTESIKPLLKYTMRLPKVDSLFQKLEASAKDNSESSFSKLDFYTDMYGAWNEIIGNKANIDIIGDQTYLLWMFYKLSETRPDLMSDPATTDFCERIENSVNQHTDFNFESEKQNFMKMLNQAKVESSSIGFNPTYKTDVKAYLDKTSLRMNGGWFDQEVEKGSAPQKTQ